MLILCRADFATSPHDKLRHDHYFGLPASIRARFQAFDGMMPRYFHGGMLLHFRRLAEHKKTFRLYRAFSLRLAFHAG